jgi:DNA polymerase I-like protein with 3'-5' exonuclease and polymerase domains
MFLGQQWKKVNPQISQQAKINENLYYQRRLKHGVGWLESPILGRRRYWTGKDFGPTDAANYPIQSAAADIVNGALIAIDPDAMRLGARLVAQVHDSLVYEVPEHNADAMKALLVNRMPGAYKFRGIEGVWSFPVDAKVGKFWSEV